MKIIHRLFYFILSILLSLNAASQKLGNIPMDLLQQKNHPTVPDAIAAHINQSAEVKFFFDDVKGLIMDTYYYYQIKIYKEEGEKYGDLELPIRISQGNEEKIRNLKAVVSNLENGEVVKTTLEKKDIFVEEVHNYLKLKKVAIPNVKPGAVIEIKYQKESPFYYTIPKWYFQDYIPTEYSKLKINAPKFINYTPITSGFVDVDISQKELSINGLPHQQYIFEARQTQPIVKDEFVLHENDYRSGIKYEIHSIELPGRPTENYSKSWNDIAENLYYDESFGKVLIKNYKDLEPIINQAKLLEEKERISFLYDYVKEDFTWNKYYSYRTTKGFKSLINNKSGSSGDLNLLLIHLLQKSGINANPLLVKLRHRGLLNVAFPSVTEINHVIAHLSTSEGDILLDSRIDLIPIGQLMTSSININGVLIKEKTAEIYMINNPNNNKSQTIYQLDYNEEENILEGIEQQRLSDFAGTIYRAQDANYDAEEEEEKEKEEENEEEQKEDIHLNNQFTLIENKNLDDINKSAIVKSDAKIVTSCKKIGSKLFIKATLHFGHEENKFKAEKRNYPVFFSSTIDEKNIAIINIPDGYQLESAPKKILAALPNNQGNFSYEVKFADQKLSIYHTYKINQDMISPEDYLALKELSDIMFKITKENIVLTKE